MNNLKWNLNRYAYIFIQEYAFENVIWKMAAILSRPQYVKKDTRINRNKTLFIKPDTRLQDDKYTFTTQKTLIADVMQTQLICQISSNLEQAFFCWIEMFHLIIGWYQLRLLSNQVI